MNRINIRFFLITIGVFLFLSSCQMGRSNYMSQEQRKELEGAYDSLQTTYISLLAEFNSSTDTLPSQLIDLYSQMQNMHSEMDISHRQMISGNLGRHMQGNNMMTEGMGMHMQGQMTGEWYSQMMGMHQQMAQMHQTIGQQSMAKMNNRLSEEYGNMRRMIPDLDQSIEVPFNTEGDPALLNGESLYSQNCASCHGGNAEGVSGIFPPLVNSKWVTGDKSIPIRIMLNGLQGEIGVQGQTYQGNMPSFKARLSAAEITSILNYLREQSQGGFSEITQDHVIRVSKNYSERTRPWTASELKQITDE